MCGICLELLVSKENIVEEHKKDINGFLKARGPDSQETRVIELLSDINLFGIFTGCVLWLQGDKPTPQPLVDDSGNVFLWNGDDLSVDLQRDRSKCDSSIIFEALISNPAEGFKHILNVEGPWSFIYYDSLNGKVHFGRDVLGRRSLLWSNPLESARWILTSVAKQEEQLLEVPAIGIFTLDLRKFAEKSPFPLSLCHYKSIYSRDLFTDLPGVKIDNTILSHLLSQPLNLSLPPPDLDLLLQNQIFCMKNLCLSLREELKGLKEVLKASLKKRVLAAPMHCRKCSYKNSCEHPKFAVLFSGGLDSALLALFLHETLEPLEEIDLLNVSFGKESFNSPDRDSGVQCWKQLEELFPSRSWNFVEINVTAEELESERTLHIRHLIAPLNSVLDDSIGCALFFASRGIGTLRGDYYQSLARVVFSGLGADEQCAGYSRHRGKFQSEGWLGLLNEVQLEMSRIHSRNLGRDDRVVSHHGRTVRFPFLDEDVVNFLNGLPIWKKANLYLPRGVGEKLLLRSLAYKSGLTLASCLPKRAIQFGSRIAKLESSKEKGHNVCQRLQ